MLVRLPETGPVLLAVDALTSAGRLEPGAPPQTQDMDHADAQRTADRLKALVEREGVRLIVFGHDGAQWRTLRLAPEFYA